LKQGKGLKTVITIVLSLLLTGLFFLVTLQFSFFNGKVMDYALTKSDFVGALGREIKAKTQMTLANGRLSESLVEDALASYDLRSEVINYFNLRIQGIDAEVDSKSFKTYIHKNVNWIMLHRQLASPDLDDSVNEITNNLVYAFQEPFVNPKLMSLLSGSGQYKRLINNLMYAFGILIVSFLVILSLLKEKDLGKIIHQSIWLSTIGSFALGVFLSFFRYQDASLSYGSLINSILQISGLLLVLVALILFYFLMMPLLYKTAKNIATRLFKLKIS